LARLIINPNAPARFEASLSRGALSIGRDPGNDLVLPDAMVSRRHAVIEYRAGRYALRDCNSSNGSLVNGDRIFEHLLRDGDVVAIGSARLLFRDDPVRADAAGKVLQHPAARWLLCPGCETAFRPGDSFCRQCGQQLEASPSLPGEACPRCAAPLREASRFCSTCGLPLEAPGSVGPLLAGGSGAAAEAGPLGTGRGASSAAAPAISALRVAPEPRQAHTSPPLVEPQRLRPRPGLAERGLAGIIDLAVTGSGQALLLAPLVWAWAERDLTAEVGFLPVLLSVLAVLATAAAGASYYIYFWGVRGATPGKRALGLVVQGRDGRYPIGVARAALRLVASLVSGVFLGVGFLMIALDGDALHDRLAGTRVVRGRRD
jgi:uncharacterized RDD family membrane protein YckC